MDTVRTVAELRTRVAAWRAGGETVGLVPTMGAIHAGHLALVTAARAACDRVVASLFVNPAQFGPNEDYQLYPRNESEDARLLDQHGVELLFAPTVDEMYPEGFTTSVSVSGLTSGLCGDHRPGHFEGVATIVAKLLIQCAPDRAFFGQKDYQQLVVVKRLARDLDIPAAIEGVPTIREPDGLALSSRNAYLSPEHRAIAPALYETISAIAAALSAGRGSIAEQVDWGIARLEEAGFERLDYLEVREAETLERLERADREARVLVAARIGGTRLIDNVPMQPA